MKLCPALLFALVACSPATSQPLPPAPPEPANGSACDAAGQRLARVGCVEAASSKGTPFAKVCEDAAGNGVDMHPECILKAVHTAEDCRHVPAASRGELCP